MSSFYATNSPTKSSAMRGLSAQNSRTMKSLDKELSRLDAERKSKMKELNQATKHFLDMKLRPSSARSRDSSPDRHSCASLPAYTRDRAMSRSPSPRPRTPLDEMFPLTSPRSHKIVYRKSLSTDGSPTSPNNLSPNSSPESQRKLLTRRNEDDRNRLKKSHSITETNKTQVSYLSLPGDRAGHVTSHSNPTTPRDKTKNPNSPSVGLPKIVVSDATPRLPDVVPKVAKSTSPVRKDSTSPVRKDSTSPARKDSTSPVRKDSTSSIRKDSTSSIRKDSTSSIRRDSKESPRESSGGSKESTEDVIDGSLRVPTRRTRSNSVPTISSSMQHLLAISKHTPTSTADDSVLQAEMPVKLRPRSSSICVPYFVHLKDAPRRDSLLRKYIARPKIFHRTAKTIDQLISDLAKGIYREELLDSKYRSKPITPEEWESLKKCRYLRMPSRDDDVKGNTIDVDAIFTD